MFLGAIFEFQDIFFQIWTFLHFFFLQSLKVWLDFSTLFWAIFTFPGLFLTKSTELLEFFQLFLIISILFLFFILNFSRKFTLWSSQQFRPFKVKPNYPNKKLSTHKILTYSNTNCWSNRHSNQNQYRPSNRAELKNCRDKDRKKNKKKHKTKYKCNVLIPYIKWHLKRMMICSKRNKLNQSHSITIQLMDKRLLIRLVGWYLFTISICMWIGKPWKKNVVHCKWAINEANWSDSA